MTISFKDVIIQNIKTFHHHELREIQAAITAYLTPPADLVDKARKIRDEQSTLHAVKFLRDAGSLNTLKEDIELVKSL